MYSVTIKTDTGAEPVTPAVVKNFIKYDETDTVEVALIASMTKAARELLEKLLNVSLKLKTYQLSFDYLDIEDFHLRLPYGPHTDTFSLSFYDYDREVTALTIKTDYNLIGLHFRELYIPSVEPDGYYVAEFDSGYDSTTELIPDALKEAICELTKYWYDRGEQTQIIPETILAKIGPYSKQYWI